MHDHETVRKVSVVTRKRAAITIHAVPLGEQGWAWELRSLDGKLVTDSNRDGEFGCFASARTAFDDAARIARDHLVNPSVEG